MDIEKEVLYEDSHVLVCKKPAGVPTQTKQVMREDMVSILKNYLALSDKEPYLGLIHRLDQPVEGILVFAKTASAAGELSRQSREGQIKKIYVAASDKSPERKNAILEDYLRKDRKGNRSEVVNREAKGGKKAILSYEILQTCEDVIFLKIILKTGRHHQIRVQCAHHGFALLGDTKYNIAYKDKQPIGSLALCAYSLEFYHPKTKEKMNFYIKPSSQYFNGISL